MVIKAKVRGHPPPTLTWYHDGKQVMTDYATELDENGGLTFPSVEAKHAGENTQCTHTLCRAIICKSQISLLAQLNKSS